MFDTHVHTEFSTDSDMKINEAMKSAEKNNVSLILTEHMDINYPEKGEFLFSPEKYFKSYSKLRGDKLLLGVEIGMKMDCLSEAGNIVRNNEFDYVIGSVHLVDNLDLYYKNFYKNKTKRECYRKYLETILYNLEKFDFIDSLGHIDYICRYAPYSDSEMNYEEFPNLIDQILKNLIENGKCMELNTRRLNRRSVVESLFKIYYRYKELGGKYLTLGSDAHSNENIAANFNTAIDIANRCNLKIVHFKNRKMEY